METLPDSQQQLLGTLYTEHHGWLQSWLRKKLGCVFEAADLAQDTFVRIALQRELENLREPRAYLTTVAHGLMVNRLRRRKLEQSYLEALAQAPSSEAPSPEMQAMLLETLLEIDAMLDGLPAKVRIAFLMVQLEDASHADIARRLDVSVSSVRKYIMLALAHCLSIEMPAV
ncbi:sigma-70 family RNA polymerase sigma factor [Methylobacillus pratensis]